ncbi:MAG: ATP-binding protein [Verrucomicrobiota bacterium]
MNLSSSAANQPRAVLLLDTGGKVVSANQDAASLTGLAVHALVGRSLMSLTRPELTSDEPDWEQTYWEVLIATTQGHPSPVTLANPSADLPVLLKLEPTGQGQIAYWAYLEPPPAPGADSATAPPLPGNDADYGLPFLASQSPLGFFDLNYKTNTVRYSAGWKRMLGYSRSELADNYDTWIELLHPEDDGAAPDKLRTRRGVTGTIPFSREFRMKHRAGHHVWIACTGVQVVTPEGTLERVCGIHLDITERKEIEETGLEHEERLRILADDAGLAAFDLDFVNHRHWFSPAWQRRLGTGADEIHPTPDPLTQLLPPELAVSDLGQLFPPADGPGEVTLNLLGPGETTRPVTIVYHRQASRRHELQRLTGFALAADAGPREASPANAAPWTDDLLATLAEGVIIADVQGRVTTLSPQAAKLLHTTPEDTVGRQLGDVFALVHLVNCQPAPDAVDLSLVAGEPVLSSEQGLRSPDGNLHPIVWTARQFWSAEGAIAGIIIVFRDPLQMSLTPEELIRANRFESLGLLAGGISHDFNNLLTTILGGISTAKENRDYNQLDDAEDACLAAKTLTRQLLTFAKGGHNAVHQTVPTLDLLQNAVRMAAAGSTCRVTVEAPSTGVNPIRVDRGQIMQVFQNLIINAIQAMPEPALGVITLRAADVRLAEGDISPLPAGDYVQIEVQDNGSGIPPEVAERIFDPFFTTKKNGTGLGLATVLSIVRRHGGQLGMQTVVGAGTTFTVFLPWAEGPVEAQVRAAPSLRFGTGRILLMDDDPKICELTGGMIASLDYTHDIARNGEEAVQLYRRYLNVNRPYDAVILDLTIVGGMGGEECFHRLRELDPDVRAIVSSGYDDDELAQRMIDQGFVGYLTKPYRVGDVGRVLKKVLGR